MFRELLILRFTTLIFFFAKLHSGESAEITDLSRLRSDLLTGYDRNARPIQNHRNSTLVRINVLLRGFEFDERRSIFTLFGWTVMRWKDEHMKWDPLSYGNLTRIHFSNHELWLPDFSVYNNLDQSEIDHFGNTRILAYSTGVLIWVPPTKFQVGCKNDLRKWPYDSQVCYFVIGSWAHDGAMLDIELPVNLTQIPKIDYVDNREWDLIFTGAKKRTRFYGSDVPYPDLLLSVGIKRKSASHTAAYIVPALGIATTVLVGFWMPPSSIERLGLILVDFLVNGLYLNYIYIDIPNNGSSVPLITLFFRDSLIMIIVALIWTICLNYLARTKRTSPVPLPGALTGFLEGLPGKILCLDPRPARDRPNHSGDSTGNDDENKLVGQRNPFAEDWAWLAHLLDRVAFVIYLIVYFSFTVGLLL